MTTTTSDMLMARGLASVPLEMRRLHRWARAEGKRPVQPSGLPADPRDPGTWSDYGDVLTGAGDGLGIMLGDGLACYDFDAFMVLERMPELLDVIKEPIVYAEATVSGTGLHVFVHSTVPGHSVSLGNIYDRVEFWSSRRFVRLTGRMKAMA